jgi:hypothetical protein
MSIFSQNEDLYALRISNIAFTISNLFAKSGGIVIINIFFKITRLRFEIKKCFVEKMSVLNPNTASIPHYRQTPASCERSPQKRVTLCRKTIYKLWTGGVAQWQHIRLKKRTMYQVWIPLLFRESKATL